jgi:ATP-dependent Clp protease ATP-binding subunit ClpB
MENFTLRTQQAIQFAQKIAVKNGHQAIEPIHIFFGCLDSDLSFCESLIQRSGINFEKLRESANQEFQNIPSEKNTKSYMSIQAQQVIENGISNAKKNRNEFLSLDYLVLGIAISKGLIGDLFQRNGFNINAFQKNYA